MSQRPSVEESIIEPTPKHRNRPPLDTRMVEIRRFALSQSVEFSKVSQTHDYTIIDVAAMFEEYIVNGAGKSDE